ncbi:hypothetical protein CHI07_21120 [Paenibacillus sp. 7884-2]|nr:hypothetical protein CHI07_21120 [Paenibacillus sp. 7884-2]
MEWNGTMKILMGSVSEMKKLIRIFFVFGLLLFYQSFYQEDKASAASYDFWDWSTWPAVNYGSSGGFVSAVQSNLWASGYQTATGTVDGSFGSNTRTAVRYFQNLEGISADGSVGPITWDAFEDHVSSGFTTRTYDHWQSSYYTVYYADGNQVYGELDSDDQLGIAYFNLWRY